jgi:hypothetical protein
LKAGQRHGVGMYEYFNGDVYKGNWKKDKKNGFGTTIKNDKSIEVGFYKENMFLSNKIC